MKLQRLALMLFTSGTTVLAAMSSFAADSVKIAVIDPLSGPFANVGEAMVRYTQLAADAINARGGVLGGARIEIIALDSKSSPQEAQLALKSAIDQGVRYINQSNGSNVAGALVDAVNKHNERNPDQVVLYLNTGAVDPALTNDRCSFWHFRFDADADMKMAALTDAIAQNKNSKKVYLINQDYAFGQAVARAAKEMLPKKRPDIEIVGDELHPLGTIKDFSPYIAKIRASGAQAVITGNWGNDFTLLIKSSKDSGLGVTFYTFNAQNAGAPSSIGAAGADHIKQVFTWHANIADNKAEKFALDFRKKYSGDFYYNTAKTELEMLARAMNDTKSTDPLKVARALEGMKYQSDTGEVWMRADDHQLMQPIYIATFTKAGGKDVRIDAEGTGFGWKTDIRIEPADTVMPTNCVMNRP